MSGQEQRCGSSEQSRAQIPKLELSESEKGRISAVSNTELGEFLLPSPSFGERA